MGILTVKIQSLIEHSQQNPKDFKTKRKLVEFMEIRRKHLGSFSLLIGRYLKARSLPRYFAILEKLNLKFPKFSNRSRPENIELPK